MTQKFDIDALIYEFRKLQLPEWPTDKYQDLLIPYEQGDWIGLEKALDIRLCYLKEVRPPFQPRKQLAVQLEIARTNAHEISRMATTLKKTITTAKPNASERGIRRIRSLEDELKMLAFEKTTLVKDNEELLLELDESNGKSHRLETLLKESNDKIRRLEQENDDLVTSLQQKESELEQNRHGLQAIKKLCIDMTGTQQKIFKPTGRDRRQPQPTSNPTRDMTIEKPVDLVKKRLSRLRLYTSTQQVQDNPNVADLSDQNRPTKLAEKFSELFDTDWTDAFEVLMENFGFSEEMAIKHLFDIVQMTYSFCSDTAEQQVDMLKRALNGLIADHSPMSSSLKLDAVQLRTIHDLRKQTSQQSMESVKKGIIQHMKNTNLASPDPARIISYVEKCTELCWYMMLPSPPLYVSPSETPGDSFDKNKYIYYQTSGKRYKFFVWPTLYLYKDGNMLSKGIAEGM